MSLDSIEKHDKIGYGDFQTPPALARKSCNFIANQHDFLPEILIEPTCGVGNFIQEAVGAFASLKQVIGIDLNEQYITEAQVGARQYLKSGQTGEFFRANAFTFQYQNYLEENKNILVLGNLPWVTNAAIGSIDHENLPQKSNAFDLRGMEAITGKSNFDISEYIFGKLIDKCQRYDAVISLLVKTSVARKLLKTIWKNNVGHAKASIAKIETKKYFNVAVDACLFTLHFNKAQAKLEKRCVIFSSLDCKEPESSIAEFNGYLTNNAPLVERNKSLLRKSDYIWRNGIKHDLSKVMELTFKDGTYYNGYGKRVSIENDLIYPLYKSSDLTKETLPGYRKYVIVTQKYIGEPTNELEQLYPKAWQYLLSYQEHFSARKSSIYKNRPLFSIFSVGNYSFSRYKIAIAAFSKTVKFHKITSVDKRPIMVDDTCNFISFDNEECFTYIFQLINHVEYLGVLNSLIFSDSKRPITTEILNNISLFKFAEKINRRKEYITYTNKNRYYANVDLQGHSHGIT